MEVEQYISQKKTLYKSLLDFIVADDSVTIDDTYNKLLVHLKRLNNEAESEEILEFLKLISIISSNYHFTVEFFEKIKKIILFLSQKIKQSFTNRQIFDIFKKNKRVLLFLFEEKIINVDDSIIHFFNSRVDELKKESESGDQIIYGNVKKMKNKYFNYCIFFYPEIKDHIDENMKKRQKVLIQQFLTTLKESEKIVRMKVNYVK